MLTFSHKFVTLHDRSTGKHTCVSFLKRLDPWTKSPFQLVCTDMPSRSASTLGFRYFDNFIENYLVELRYFLYFKIFMLKFELNSILLFVF